MEIYINENQNKFGEKEIKPLSAKCIQIVFLARPPLVSCSEGRCHVRECYRFHFASSLGGLAGGDVGSYSKDKKAMKFVWR
jgi:hypothetical protein